MTHGSHGRTLELIRTLDLLRSPDKGSTSGLPSLCAERCCLSEANPTLTSALCSQRAFFCFCFGVFASRRHQLSAWSSTFSNTSDLDLATTDLASKAISNADTVTMNHNGSSTHPSQDPVGEKPLDASTPSTPPQEQPVVEEPVKPGAQDQDSIPDGGLQAWLQVLGGFMIFFNTWGLLNTFGVFQTYYASGDLFTASSSDISWIGSIQVSAQSRLFTSWSDCESRDRILSLPMQTLKRSLRGPFLPTCPCTRLTD